MQNWLYSQEISSGLRFIEFLPGSCKRRRTFQGLRCFKWRVSLFVGNGPSDQRCQSFLLFYKKVIYLLYFLLFYQKVIYLFYFLLFYQELIQKVI